MCVGALRIERISLSASVGVALSGSSNRGKARGVGVQGKATGGPVSNRDFISRLNLRNFKTGKRMNMLSR